MEIVIDTSALMAVLLDEPEAASLVRATEGATLAAPPSVPWEVGNAFVALIRRGRLTTAQARRLVRGFGGIPLRYFEVDLERAVGLAADLELYAYDAYLLEAARTRGAPLLTLDRRLERAAQRIGVATVGVQL